jgi:hypothetical protein
VEGTYLSLKKSVQQNVGEYTHIMLFVYRQHSTHVESMDWLELSN